MQDKQLHNLSPVGLIFEAYIQKEEKKQNTFRDEIRSLLVKVSTGISDKPFLDVSEACHFLSISKSHIYKLNHYKKLPFFKRGKKVYYDKDDLIAYITTYKILSEDMIEARKQNFLSKK